MKINLRFINNENNEAYSGNISKKVSKMHNIEDLSPDALMHSSVRMGHIKRVFLLKVCGNP